MALVDPILYAIPAFIGLLLLEIWAASRRYPERYEARDTWVSLTLGVGSQVAAALTGGAVVAMAVWAAKFQIFDIGLDFRSFWWAWIACFVLDDLAYYVFHRTAHRVRWFWASHVIHHSSQHYNLSTALRQTWTGFISLSFLFRMPLFLIFPVEMVLFCGALNLIYQFWIHTEMIGRMPRWFEAVMNTPSHHRVHHGVNPRYLDSNYAGVFIVWDRMFGTFVPERDDEPVRYGIVKQLGSFNLLWAAVHEWVGIVRDIWAAPWRHKLGYLWKEPGWSHDGSRNTSAMIKSRWEAKRVRGGARDDAGAGKGV
jgi:sterol desaturase/sphingolipid hydroxylase (fatty acid hydroxylase superfamily)